MKKFEYKVIAVPKVFAIGEEYYKKKKTKFETKLNKLGANGWELVQCTDDFFFLKREISVE